MIPPCTRPLDVSALRNQEEIRLLISLVKSISKALMKRIKCCLLLSLPTNMLLWWVDKPLMSFLLLLTRLFKTIIFALKEGSSYNHVQFALIIVMFSTQCYYCVFTRIVLDS